MKNSFARVPDTDFRACSNDSTWCSMALSVILNDMMTTGLVPSDTVPGYIGYRWYGSNAIKKNRLNLVLYGALGYFKRHDDYWIGTI